VNAGQPISRWVATAAPRDDGEWHGTKPTPSITASKLKNQSLLIASIAKQTKNHSHVIASIAKQTKNHSHVIASIAKQTSVLCSMPNQPISRWIATAAPRDDGGWDRTRGKTSTSHVIASVAKQTSV